LIAVGELGEKVNLGGHAAKGRNRFRESFSRDIGIDRHFDFQIG
jgi:hypothetical protein